MKIAVVLFDYDEARKLLGTQDVNNLLFELRIDSDLNLLNLIKLGILKSKDCIITLRSKRESGLYDNSANWSPFIDEVISLAPGYIDLELRRDLEYLNYILNNSEASIILSHHNYSRPMSTMTKDIVDELTNAGLDFSNKRIIYKIVGNPEDIYDTVKSMRILEGIFSNSIKLGIGKHGELTRTCANYLDQYLIFGGFQSKQIIDYQILRKLNNKPLLLGLIGKLIDKSLSPRIHHNIIEKYGLNN